MKKNLFYAGMLLLGMTVATGCSNEETLEQVASNGKTIQAVIEKATEARTSVSDNYQVLWTEDDAFSVFDNGTKKATLTLSDGEGTTSGKFTIDDSEVTITENMVALFPASDVLGYTFATSYTSQETDAPMLGTFANGKFTFELLTAMVRVVVTNVPQGTATLAITAGTDINLTGAATLNSNNDLDVPTSGTNAVTVTIENETAGATLTFDVPVPAQSYTGGLNVTLTVDNDEFFNKTTNEFTAAVGKIYVFGAKTVSVDDAEDLTSTIQDLLEGGYSVVLEGEAEEVAVSGLSVPENTTASLDLNGKKLNLGEASPALVRSASTNYGLFNEGTLVLTNGSISFEGTADNAVAIGNKGNLTLDNVDVTSTAFCVTNVGTWADDKTLENQGEPTVVLNITGGVFTSSYTHTSGLHIYAIRCADNAKMTIKDATVTSTDAGIEVNCAYADLYNVKATEECSTTGHGLYISCAEVNYDGACQFSDVCVDTNAEWAEAYGPTVVNGTTYSSTQSIGVTVSTLEELTNALNAGKSVVLTKSLEITSKLQIGSGNSAMLNLGGNTLTFKNISDYGLLNKGTLTLTNGSITFEGTADNAVAIGNKGNLTLDNVDVTSTAFCVTNVGTWADDKTLENQGEPTVVLNITGGVFTSSYTHTSSELHAHAIRCADNAKMTITDATVTGDAGIEVNCAYADLYNVKATENCDATGHGLYISCAVVNYDTACQFSDVCVDTNANWAEAYGPTVVNNTTYNSTQIIN